MSTVLVTGGSRGIGREICISFAKAGYDIAFCYQKDEKGAKETLELIRKAGGEASVFCCDVSDEQQVERMFSSVFGLEILVNNAGMASFGLIQDMSLCEWNRVFSVNMTGAFLCTRAAIPKLRSRGGCIINVASMWGEVGASCEAAYSASKAALIGFTKAAAKELGPCGIRVNAVSCGMIETQMNSRFSAEEVATFTESIPLKRQGSPEEVARAVCFLAENRYITGEILRVNGGAVI